MCWIAFARKRDLRDYFSIASGRWTDWLGSICESTISVGYAVSTREFLLANYEELWCLLSGAIEWTIHNPSSYALAYQVVLNQTLKGIKDNKFALIHHRKSSIGKDGIENVHPFPLCDWRYYLAQNGSSKKLHEWGTIQFIKEDEVHSDTYFLAKYLELNGWWTLAWFSATLDQLSEVTQIWVITIYDKVKNEFLVYSDGARSLYFDISEDYSIVNRMSSLDEVGDDGYAFSGYLVISMKDGRVSDGVIDYINKYTEKKKSYYDNRPVNNTVEEPKVPLLSQWKETFEPTSLDKWIQKEEERKAKDYALLLEKKDREYFDSHWNNYDDDVDPYAKDEERDRDFDPSDVIKSSKVDEYTYDLFRIEWDMPTLLSKGTAMDVEIALAQLEATSNAYAKELDRLLYAWDEESITSEKWQTTYDYVEQEKESTLLLVQEYNPNFKYSYEEK